MTTSKICPICKDELYAITEKICIQRFGKCTVCINENEYAELLEIINV